MHNPRTRERRRSAAAAVLPPTRRSELFDPDIPEPTTLEEVEPYVRAYWAKGSPMARAHYRTVEEAIKDVTAAFLRGQEENPRGRNLYGAGKAILSSGMSFGSQQDPSYWPARGHLVYMDRGAWFYKSAEPVPGFSGWYRASPDPARDIDRAMMHGELKDRVGNPSAGGGKELWEMTRAEYRAFENGPKVRAIQDAIGSGTPIVLATYGRATKLTSPGHIRMDSNGDVRIPSGRKWLALTPPQVDSLAAQAGIEPVAFMDRVYHHGLVEEALAEGKPVPPEVLADYPELRAGNPGVVKRFLGGALGNAKAPKRSDWPIGKALAGAVQGVVEPYVTRHVYGVGTRPVGAEAANPRQYAFVAHYVMGSKAGKQVEKATWPRLGRTMSERRAMEFNAELERRDCPWRLKPLFPVDLPHWIGMGTKPVGVVGNPESKSYLLRPRALQAVRELRAKGYAAGLGTAHRGHRLHTTYSVVSDAPTTMVDRLMWRLSATYRKDRVPDTEEEFERRFPVGNPAPRLDKAVVNRWYNAGVAHGRAQPHHESPLPVGQVYFGVWIKSPESRSPDEYPEEALFKAFSEGYNAALRGMKGNPRRRFMDELMAEHIRMPGFPQMIVTRAFLHEYLKGLGWDESERGRGSLDATVFLPKPVDEPLTDEETRDYNLSLPGVREIMGPRKTTSGQSREGNPEPSDADVERWAQDWVRRGVNARQVGVWLRKAQRDLAEHREWLQSKGYPDDGVALKMLHNIWFWERTLELHRAKAGKIEVIPEGKSNPVLSGMQEGDGFRWEYQPSGYITVHVDKKPDRALYAKILAFVRSKGVHAEIRNKSGMKLDVVSPNPYGEPTFRKGRRTWSGQMGGAYSNKAEAVEAARQFATEIMAPDGQPRDEVTIWTTGGGKKEMFKVEMAKGKRGSHAA